MHALPSVRAQSQPALMAAIIKKAFKEGRATEGTTVGVMLGWCEYQTNHCY